MVLIIDITIYYLCAKITLFFIPTKFFQKKFCLFLSKKYQVPRHTDATLLLSLETLIETDSQKVTGTRRYKDNADLRKEHWQEQARGGGHFLTKN